MLGAQNETGRAQERGFKIVQKVLGPKSHFQGKGGRAVALKKQHQDPPQKNPT